jgi:hypothetical protein
LEFLQIQVTATELAILKVTNLWNKYVIAAVKIMQSTRSGKSWEQPILRDTITVHATDANLLKRILILLVKQETALGN